MIPTVTNMAHLFKWLLSLLLLPLTVSFTLEAFFTLREEVLLAEIIFVGVGFVSYLFLYPFLYGKNFLFIEIFEHELSHMILKLFWRRTLIEFLVNPTQKSHVESRGIVNVPWLTALAPYYLPVFTLPLIFLHAFFNTPILPFVDIAIGMTLAFHYVALFKEFGLHQTDIQPYTLPLAFLITSLLNIVFLMLIISFVIEHRNLFGLYLERAYLRSLVYYDDSWFLLNELWHEFNRTPYR